ncbi:MAG TPA: protein kinase [Chthonomonadaceae bacterium]|nr:protein kinase [Chthonomonadaceae bacterium]
MFEAGRKIGPYVLERRLGEGSYGVVWLAGERTGLIERQVALKLPKDAEPDLEAIRREAAVWLSAGKHANVVQVLHADIYDGQVAIATEFIPGGSLQERLRRAPGGVLPTPATIEMTRGILAGLEHLHALPPKPLVHRDLKPGNVLLRGDTPLLTDFGLTRAFSSTVLTQAGGTPGYMPPEAFDDRFSPQTDIWAAGVTLYRMLKGELPFPQRDLSALVGAILGREPEPLPESVPRPVAAVIFMALMKDPDRRFGSAEEMRVALEDAAREGSARTAIPATLLQPIPPIPGSGRAVDFDIRTPSGSADPFAATRTPLSSGGTSQGGPRVPDLAPARPAGPAPGIQQALPGYGAPDPPRLDMPALPLPHDNRPAFDSSPAARADPGGAPPSAASPAHAVARSGHHQSGGGPASAPQLPPVPSQAARPDSAAPTGNPAANGAQSANRSEPSGGPPPASPPAYGTAPGLPTDAGASPPAVPVLDVLRDRRAADGPAIDARQPGGAMLASRAVPGGSAADAIAQAPHSDGIPQWRPHPAVLQHGDTAHQRPGAAGGSVAPSPGSAMPYGQGGYGVAGALQAADQRSDGQGALSPYSEALTALPESFAPPGSLSERIDRMLGYLAGDTTRYCCALLGSIPVWSALGTLGRLVDRSHLFGAVSGVVFACGIMSVLFARLAWHRYRWKPEAERRASAIRYAILGCFSGVVVPVVAVTLYVAVATAIGAPSETPPREPRPETQPPIPRT